MFIANYLVYNTSRPYDQSVLLSSPTSVSINAKYMGIVRHGAKTPLLSFNGAFDRGITDAVLGTN